MPNLYRDEVLSGRTSVKKVLETERVLAYHHTRPMYPVHIVVISKANIDSLVTLQDDVLMLELMQAVQRVAAQVLESHGASTMITNLGEYQDSQHLHFHVIFGKANT
jgi:histidine triad (HIT) family protein